MNLTLELLRTIGSPFCDKNDLYLPKTKEDALELYKYAVKNKIGLLYLESLDRKGALRDFRLEEEYKDETCRHDQQVNTASRVAGVLNSSVDYAIFKSLMPFQATPNDVDIIHFGSDEAYQRVIELMLQSGYMEVKGEVDAEQRMFHDVELGGYLNPHPKKKDVYDVDLYQKVSASKTIYLDKWKIKKYVKDIEIYNSNIKVLEDEAELAAIIIHSIIPEMICTLFVYYATLFYLFKLDIDNIKIFIDISKENCLTNSVRSHCSLVKELHRSAHGEVPEKLELILNKFGEDTRERNFLVKDNFIMPHRYSLMSVVRILLEKSRENGFKISFVRQIVYMLNPRHAKWIFYELVLRRRRDTY